MLISYFRTSALSKIHRAPARNLASLCLTRFTERINMRPRSTPGHVVAWLLWQSAASSASVVPSVKQATILGDMADPSINRDSCAAATERIVGRALWTCRDSQGYNSDGVPGLPLWSSSASWSNFESDGTPSTNMYGTNDKKPFYVYGANECGSSTAGECSDGTRYALWPNSPPLVVHDPSDGVVTAYTWIPKAHIKGLTVVGDPNPATSLYKITYDTSTASTDQNTLPNVTLVEEDFWAASTVPYGAYGNVIRDGTVYLYGQPASKILFLAKVSTDSIEDPSQYQFYVDGEWTGTVPSVNDTSANISNGSAGGQGTYYYSSLWDSYVWIGASGGVGADFMVTTAPNPEGPWEEPTLLYSGASGNGSLGAYSTQANPALNEPGKNEIYLTYTKQNEVDGVAKYETPLIQVEFS